MAKNFFSNLLDPDCRRGVAIFVREELQAGVIIPTNNYRPWIETVCLNIIISIICFGCIYCSPSSPSQIISKNALSEMLSYILKIISFEKIIVGDSTCQKFYGLMENQQIKVIPKLFWRHASTKKPDRHLVPDLWKNGHIYT